MTKTFASLALAGILIATTTGCSKSSQQSSSTQASPGSKMVYPGSTDTSTGASMAPAAASGPISAGDATHGKEIFTANCTACHGATGTEGGVGPSLKGEKAKKDLAATVAWIKKPAPPMPKLYPSPLNEKDVIDVATYVQSL